MSKTGPVGSGVGDFIGKYVFPHGELPHLHLAVREMAAAGFEVVDVEVAAAALCQDARALVAAPREPARRGGSAGQRHGRCAYGARTWPAARYGFEQGWVSIHQLLGSVQRRPGSTGLPLTRDWMYRV